MAHPSLMRLACTFATQVEIALHPTRVVSDIHIENLLCFASTQPHPAGTPFPPPRRPAADPSAAADARAPSPMRTTRAAAADAASREPVDTQHLYFTLTGACTEQVPDGEPVRFVTPVRTACTVDVPLPNRGPQALTLRPLVSGEGFTGPAVVEVPGGVTAKYPVTYCPLQMTGGATGRPPDSGLLFVALPDGSAVMRTLVGEALEPTPAGTLEWTLEVPRGALTAQLPVRNWLRRPQRFRVETALEGGATLGPGDGANALGLTLAGPPSIDVPPLQERACRLVVRALREGTLSGVVRFVADRPDAAAAAAAAPAVPAAAAPGPGVPPTPDAASAPPQQPPGSAGGPAQAKAPAPASTASPAKGGPAVAANSKKGTVAPASGAGLRGTVHRKGT